MNGKSFLLVVMGLASVGAFAESGIDESPEIRDVGACVRHENGQRHSCVEASRHLCNSANQEYVFGDRLRGLTSFYFYPGDRCRR